MFRKKSVKSDDVIIFRKNRHKFQTVSCYPRRVVNCLNESLIFVFYLLEIDRYFWQNRMWRQIFMDESKSQNFVESESHIRFFLSLILDRIKTNIVLIFFAVFPGKYQSRGQKSSCEGAIFWPRASYFPGKTKQKVSIIAKQWYLLYQYLSLQMVSR